MTGRGWTKVHIALERGQVYSCVMDSAPLPLPETRDRRCPDCGNRAVVGLGHVTASATGIRCDYRCPDCSTEFVLLFSMRLMIETDWSALLGDGEFAALRDHLQRLHDALWPR